MSNLYHQPVLLHYCIEGLNINPAGVYVDVTFGGGGHSREILSKLENKGTLIGFDQDLDAEKNQLKDARFTLIKQNFRYLKNNLRLEGKSVVDGLLADLGVSSWQFDTAERGFSIREDAVLDMRMDQNAALSAKEIVNSYEQEHLKKIFKEYGELKNGGKVAFLICRERVLNPISTVFQLKEVIKPQAPKFKDAKFYAKVFQSLRIEVNKELDALKEMLLQSEQVIAKGGRLVVISYHSLEDRLVKNFIKSGNFEGKEKKDFYGNVIKPFKAINRKIIVASQDEININNRARSAKLRIAERL